MFVEVIEEIRKFVEKKGFFEKWVFMLFFGGKDSFFVFYILKEVGFDVLVLIFFYCWSWREIFNWVMRFIKKFSVEYYFVDIIEGFFCEVVGRKGLVCINCKKVMFWNVKWFVFNSGFDVLVKGDNVNDKIIGVFFD